MALSHKQKLFLSSKLCSQYFNFKYLLLELLQLTMNTKLKHIPEIVAIVILSMFCCFLSQTRNWRNLLRSFQLFLSQQTMFYPMLRFVLLMTQRIRDNSSHYSSVTTVRRSSFILFYVLYPRRIFINDDTCLYRLWHQINLQSLYNRIYFGVKYNATLMARNN